ncbi:MAG: thioredoxin-disulfide reductase [Puniceicoccales bacterium]|jgi:thioredoxin reductase (NADPH)|nr:thioredoxin-disulfide reductase [Puniceicoccales bacterium]
MDSVNLVIIGSGCAGLTAAIYAARANLSPVIVAGTQSGGQLVTTSNVENFPGFPEGINGFELMENMRTQAERFGAQFLSSAVERSDLSEKKLYLDDQKKFKAKTIIIATGASPRLLNIPGEREFFGGKGVSVCATCDGIFFKNREVVVIGGGDSACEEAHFLARFCSKVYIIHRRGQLRASKIMADRALAHPKIEILWNTIPLEICGEKKVTHIRIKEGERERDLPCSGVFLAIGHIPNTQVFEGQIERDREGYILSDGAYSSIPGIFVAGDCCDPVYRQAITAAGMGAAAGISAERYLYE